MKQVEKTRGMKDTLFLTISGNTEIATSMSEGKNSVKVEAAWPSGLGRWCCNWRSRVQGFRPRHQRDLFLGSPEFKPSVTLSK